MAQPLQVSFAVQNHIPPQHLFHMRNPEGSLTLSGMLYEGNWAEWEIRFHGLMCQHSEQGIKLAHDAFWRNGAGTDDTLTPIAKELSVIVRGMVSPNMLLRLPIGDGIQSPHDFNWLLQDLQRLAQPFPLMKLPTELRLRIYGSVLTARDPLFHPCKVTIQPHHRFMSTKIHPLSRVSRKTRQEFLPVFFEQTKIELVAGPQVVNGLTNWLAAQEICAFESTMGSENIKLMRSMSFPLGRLGNPEFSYAKVDGVKMVSQWAMLPARVQGCFDMCTRVTEGPQGEDGEHLVLAMRTARGYNLQGLV